MTPENSRPSTYPTSGGDYHPLVCSDSWACAERYGRLSGSRTATCSAVLVAGNRQFCAPGKEEE